MKRTSYTYNADADVFWDTVTRVPPDANEADVELQIVMPLLSALGFERSDIRPKVPVVLKEGSKRGRSFEADYVAYSAAPHGRDTSLLVVEAKTPGKPLNDARKQGESYAIALRAPSLLLTDGVTLQVWQLQSTLDNMLVCECALSDIKAQRGKLEQLIGKQALIEHAASLAHKKLATTPDFSRYAIAEIERTKEASKAIERTLRSESGQSFSSAELLDKYPQGAVIRAPSGYGKTTLAARLLQKGIQRRRENPESEFPIDVPLIDLCASGLSPIEFALERIAAHIPQMKLATIQDIARSDGLLLVCDGFERLEPTARPQAESQLRHIARDFPKSKLFIFSRGSVAPQVSLPHLQLQALDHNEQRMMATRLSGVYFPASSMPRLLMELSEIPLLMERIIAFWMVNKRFPVRLEELFEHWMRQLLDGPSADATAGIIRDKLLQAFARELGARRMTPSQALTFATDSGGDHQTFDFLVRCGALVLSAASVDFIHEGLADYVRARTLLALPLPAMSAALTSINMDEDSLLPVLLAAQVKDQASREYIWEHLQRMPLPRYIDAIRFSEDVAEPFTAANIPASVGSFAEDMAGSITAMLDSYFPSISTELRGCLSQQPNGAGGLRLILNVAPAPNARLTYSLQPDIANAVQIIWPSPNMSRHTWNLASNQVGIQDGRYMGAIAVRDAVNELVRQRRFRGGVRLANERSIGRLRFLQAEYNFPVHPQEEVHEILQRLQPIEYKIVAPNHFSSFPAFTIKSMIVDLELLLAHEQQRLDWWWLQFGSTEELIDDQQRLSGFLQEHYSRMTALYTEIVETSFARVTKEFSLIRALPAYSTESGHPVHGKLATQSTPNWATHSTPWRTVGA